VIDILPTVAVWTDIQQNVPQAKVQVSVHSWPLGWGAQVYSARSTWGEHWTRGHEETIVISLGQSRTDVLDELHCSSG
jgi:hypothetical protein